VRTARIVSIGRTRLVALVAVLTIVGVAAAPLAPTRMERAAAAAGSAIITHSADGVLLRSEPDFGAGVIGTLAEGTVVGLRTDETDTIYDADGTTRWWPIRTDVGDGWVAGFYLQVVGNPDAQEAAAPVAQAAEQAPAEQPAVAVPAGDDGAGLGGSAARVADPEGVNLRAQPSLGGESLGALSFDAPVELLIDQTDTVYADGGRWWPVRANGQDGWVLGTYLAPAAGQASDADGQQPAVSEAQQDVPAADQTVANTDAPGKQGPPNGPLFSIGSYVQAITDDGTGLNIRTDAAPDAERVGSVPENDVVQVMDGPFQDPTGTGWYLVTEGGVTGYVISTFLSQANQPAAPDGDRGRQRDQPGLSPPDLAPAAGVATGTFIFSDASATLTQGYGCSPYWFEPWDPGAGCNFHNGLDLADSYYTPLQAVDGGVVEYAGWCDCGLGYYVKIDHGDGFKSVYGHMAEQPWVSTGEAVSKGEVIGPMGSTGNSTGPHVHFMLELNGSTVDPSAYVG